MSGSGLPGLGLSPVCTVELVFCVVSFREPTVTGSSGRDMWRIRLCRSSLTPLLFKTRPSGLLLAAGDTPYLSLVDYVELNQFSLNYTAQNICLIKCVQSCEQSFQRLCGASSWTNTWIDVCVDTMLYSLFC